MSSRLTRSARARMSGCPDRLCCVP
jgi:hypothetical protein